VSSAASLLLSCARFIAPAPDDLAAPLLARDVARERCAPEGLMPSECRTDRFMRRPPPTLRLGPTPSEVSQREHQYVDRCRPNHVIGKPGASPEHGCSPARPGSRESSVASLYRMTTASQAGGLIRRACVAPRFPPSRTRAGAPAQSICDRGLSQPRSPSVPVLIIARSGRASASFMMPDPHPGQQRRLIALRPPPGLVKVSTCRSISALSPAPQSLSQTRSC
jgi:hypothetical protein